MNAKTDKAGFLNRLHSLFNIDGYLLPELTQEQQRKFMDDPVRYLMRADDVQSDAIWREVEKRQSLSAIQLDCSYSNQRCGLSIV